MPPPSGAEPFPNTQPDPSLMQFHAIPLGCAAFGSVLFKKLATGLPILYSQHVPWRDTGPMCGLD